MNTQPTQQHPQPNPAPAWTPGPWIISSQGNVVDGRLARIATVEPMPGNNPDEKLANAVLMASAPELAELIARIARTAEGGPFPAAALHAIIIDARAILARLHGEGGAK